MPEIEDPLISTWFSLEFQGSVGGAFRECTGMGSENEVVTNQSVSPTGLQITQMIPGRLKWNSITLKRGITSSMDMWTWRGLVEKGQIKEARKNGSVTMYDHKGTAIAKWDFVNAWPSKITGPSATANANEVGLEELVITHEGYERTQ
jgi:phage tail-like protein